MSTERLYATFYVDDAHFCVDALGVQEVLRHQPMTRVPLAGAESSRVVRTVLFEVLALAVVGVAIALPLGWWLTQLVRSQLYGVEPRDPLREQAPAPERRVFLV